MDLVTKVTLGRAKTKVFPQFKSGDTIGVHVKVKEGEKERVQLFKGIVIKVQGRGMGRSFTVRKMASGVGVERTFPFVSPSIHKIDLISRGKVRRARLFYLRHLRGRAARLDSELVRPDERSTKKKKKTSSPENETFQTATVPESQDPEEKMESVIPNFETSPSDTAPFEDEVSQTATDSESQDPEEKMESVIPNFETSPSDTAPFEDEVSQTATDSESQDPEEKMESVIPNFETSPSDTAPFEDEVSQTARFRVSRSRRKNGVSHT